ncbi:hypothetical protein Q3G72_024542 [Acer saccharum]|nr:hypothetical protein Q3G72_024542 [Acer saccharum]
MSQEENDSSEEESDSSSNSINGFVEKKEKNVHTQFVREANWKKRGEVSLPEESRKILQKIKDEKYDPLGRGGDRFHQHQVDLVLKIYAPSPGIPKLPIPSARPGSSNVLELEAQLGHSQGKPSVPTSPSPAWVSYSSSSKTDSTSSFARLAKFTLYKGKRILKAPKVPASKEKEPPALIEKEVVEAFRR